MEKDTQIKVIKEFQDDYRFLSNFHPSIFDYEDKEYKTVEHAYQAYKTKDKVERALIANAETPGKAKRMGQLVELRPDWERIKLGLMKELVRAKFKQNRHLKIKLLNTKGYRLIEGNTWGDTFWGKCHGEGKNHLGRLLMEIREELENA